MDILLILIAAGSLTTTFALYIEQNKKIKGQNCKYNNIVGCYEKCCGYCDNKECQRKCGANPRKCGGLF